MRTLKICILIIFALTLLPACNSNEDLDQTLNIESSLCDSEIGYTVRYPSGWKVEGAGDMEHWDNNILFMNGEDVNDNHFPSSLGIVYLLSEQDTDMDLEELSSSFQQESSLMFDNYILVSDSTTKVNGDDATVWVYSGDSDPQSVFSPEEENLAVVNGIQSLKSKNAILLHNDEFYWVFYTSVDVVYDDRYFDWFIENLEFKQ